MRRNSRVALKQTPPMLLECVAHVTAECDVMTISSGWTLAGILCCAGEGDRKDLDPNRATFPLRGEETGATFSLTEFTMVPPPVPALAPHGRSPSSRSGP